MHWYSFNLGLLIPTIAWLMKEIISQLLTLKRERNARLLQASIDKKRFNYEKKHEVYEQVFSYLRKTIGSFNSLMESEIYVKSHLDNVIAFYEKKYKDNKSKLNEFKADYEHEEKRITYNTEQIIQNIYDSFREFNNYVTVKCYLFSESEIKLIRELKDNLEQLYKYTIDFDRKAEKMVEKGLIEYIKKCFEDNEKFKAIYKEIDDLMSQIEKMFRKETSID